MFLRYYLNDKGERVYTFKVFYFYLLFSMSLMTERRLYVLILRDSPPNDKFSQERITLKKRFNLLLTDHPDIKL